MATYMFILKPRKKTIKTVCPTCAARGEVIQNCPTCHGTATKGHSITEYYVNDRPVEITHIDRDPDTGILRYWEGACEFLYETVDSSLNKYVPDVPYGIHLAHDSMLSAQRECKRINEFLHKQAVENKLNENTSKFSIGLNF